MKSREGDRSKVDLGESRDSLDQSKNHVSSHFILSFSCVAVFYYLVVCHHGSREGEEAVNSESTFRKGETERQSIRSEERR